MSGERDLDHERALRLGRCRGRYRAAWAILTAALATSCQMEDEGLQFERRGVVVMEIGTDSGPETLSGRPLQVLPDSAGGYIVVDGSAAIRTGPTGPVGHLGRTGEGPGEYRMPMSAEVAPDGTVWVFDPQLQRAVGFDWQGEPAGEIPLPIASYAVYAAFLPDGSLLLRGPGVGDRSEYLMHRYIWEQGEWTSFLSFSEPPRGRFEPPEWPRLLAIHDSASIATVSQSYEVHVLQLPAGDTVASWTGGGPAWDPFFHLDAEDNRTAGVLDVQGNGDGTAWILGLLPVRGAERAAILDTISEAGRRAFDREPYTSSILELVDLRSGEVLERIVTPRSALGIVGPGPLIAHYAGDLPYPQVEVISFACPAGESGCR